MPLPTVDDVAVELYKQFKHVRFANFRERIENESWRLEDCPDVGAEPEDVFDDFTEEYPVENAPNEIIRDGRLHVSQLMSNKLTTLYIPQWMSEGTASFPDDRLIGSVYKSWFRAQNGDPDINFGRYFAIPMNLQTEGPSTVTGLIAYHLRLCDLAAVYLAEKVEAQKGAEDERKSAKFYRILPLCRAVLAFLDRYPSYEPVNVSEDPRRPVYSLEEYAEKQTVVLVRTGDERGLVHGVDFSSLSGCTLPLDIPGIQPAAERRAVRVSLNNAISFLVHLQKEEESANSEIYRQPGVDKWINPNLKVRNRFERWYPSCGEEFVNVAIWKGGKYDVQQLKQDAADRAHRRLLGQPHREFYSEVDLPWSWNWR